MFVFSDNRGFMTANGQPDNARAARYILKDFINGKLIFCNAPPNVPQELYHAWPERQKSSSESKVMPPKAARAVRVSLQKLFIILNLKIMLIF